MQLKNALRNAREIGKRTLVATSLATGLILIGCGGGSSGGTSTTTPSTSLSGVAAAGAPITNGIGYALDAVTGTKISFTTNVTTGAYNVDLSGKTGPFLLHVVGVSSGGAPVDLYSLATSASFGKTVNVTPLSDVVVGYAAGQTAASLEASCTANLAACPALLNSIIAKLALSNSNIMSAIPSQVFTAFGLTPATFNAITTSFAATHTGVDGLLDALQVVPPASAGTSYAINLLGSTSTPLATIPLAGTGTAPTAGPVPSAGQLKQAQNLAVAMAELQAAIANFNQLMATAAPGLPTQAQLLPYFHSTLLFDGMNKATMAYGIANNLSILRPGAQIIGGAQAPFSGAAWGVGATDADPSVTYDVNDCVTSLSVYFGRGGVLTDIVQYKKTFAVPTTPTSCAGTWTFAGNQDQYWVELQPIFNRNIDSFGNSTIQVGIQLKTSADDTVEGPAPNPRPAYGPVYASVTISGPGFTTQGNFAAKGSGIATPVSVKLVPPAGASAALLGQGYQNEINDSYYTGTDVLEDCAALKAWATSTTPCYDSTAAIAGSSYVIQFKSAVLVVLETVKRRLHVTLAATTVPDSWYPTITSVNPAQASLIPANTATTVTTTWTLHAGAVGTWGDVNLFDNMGNFIWRKEQGATTATTNSISIPATGAVTSVPTSGRVGVAAPIGGLGVGASLSF